MNTANIERGSKVQLIEDDGNTYEVVLVDGNLATCNLDGEYVGQIRTDLIQPATSEG